MQSLDNARHGGSQRAIDGTAAGAFVAAATEMLGHSGDIHLSFAANADAITATGKFAEKYGDLHISNRERVID